MRHEITHSSTNHIQEVVQKTKSIVFVRVASCLKHFGIIFVVLCLSGVIFAQTNSEGATSAMTKAGAPAGSYALSGFENVNLFNGNLNFNLPLVKIGGRGKAQSSVNLAVNSARWNVQLDPNDTRNSNPGVVKSSNGSFFESLEIPRALAACYQIVNLSVRRQCLLDAYELESGYPPINPDFNLIDTGLLTAPGSYYRSYTITETNREIPGYSPGVLVARKGKIFKNTLVRLFFTSADGTEYELRDTVRDGQPYREVAGGTYSRGQVFVSPDGTGLRFVSNIAISDNSVTLDQDDRVSGTLYFPDGTTYEIVNGNVVSIKDVNGNKIIYAYTNNKVVNILDSLGRQVQFTYDNAVLASDSAYDPNDEFLKYDEIKTQLNSQDWQVVKVYRTKLGKALRSDFPEVLSGSDLFPEFSDVTLGLYNPDGVVKRVELPDHRTYKLFYTPYNEIARVVLPTGGAFEYDFPMPSPSGSGEPNRTIFRPVKERRVYANGGSRVNNDNYNSKQKYVRYAPLGTYPNHDSKVTIEEYSGNVNLSSPNDQPQVFKTDHYFYSLPDSISHNFYPEWNEGREYKTETFDSTTNLTAYGQLRQRTLTEWKDATHSEWGIAKKVQIDSVTSTVFENGKSLTQKTTYGYDNASLLNNKTDEKISDYGTGDTSGRNLKHTKTYYLKIHPTSGLDYTSDTINLHGLPEKSELYEINPDNSETLISTSEVKYDEPAYGLLPGGVTTGWVDPGNTPRGNATTSIVYNLSAGGSLSTHAQFDELGNGRKAWDARGMMSEVQYDPAMGSAFPTKSISAKPAPAPNPFGASEEFITTTNYNFYTGLVNSVTDTNNQTAQTSYIDPATNAQDLLLRPHKVTAPNGLQTVFEYGDAVGSLYVKVKKQIDATNWAESTSFIDGLGRTYKTQTKDAGGDVFTETEFDNLGRVKRSTNPYRSGDTKLWSETRYDALGRAVESFAPKATGRGDSLGITSYDLATGDDSIYGMVVVGTDAAGRKGRSITNALGQLVRVDEPTATNGTIDGDLGTLPAPSQPTYYRYDALGRMIEVTQGGQTGQKRLFLYDSLGRLLRVRQPEQEFNPSLDLAGHPTNSQWTAGFTYDENGNVRTATDAKNVTITNDYDQLNRVKTRSYSGETGAVTPTAYYTYDGIYYSSVNYKMTAENAVKGALTQVRNGISTSQTTKYDTFGRPTEYQQITDGVTYTSKYAYNLAGALVEETYPSTRTVKNEFNADGNLLRIAGKVNDSATEKTYVNSFSYTAAGGINQMRLGNGRWETAKFNDRLQMKELGLGNSATDASLWKVAFDYGELNGDGTSVNQTKNTGNIARQTISFAGLAQPFVQSYRYDSLYRLTESRETTAGATQPNWLQGLTYDRFGNRLTINTVIGGVQNGYTPTVDAATNRFNLGQGFTYDKNGNITTDTFGSQNRNFTFNGDNKQTEIRDANIATSPSNPDANLIGRYSYDGEGKRVKKETNTETTIFVYSGGKLIQEYSTKLPDQPSINYTTSDHLGTPRIITDELGAVKARRDFMPFGEELLAGVGGRTSDTGQKYSATKDEIRQKFTGYQKDAETQLDFAEARMYNNAHGRFTAVDPLLASGNSANPQTFNRYVYVGNNPLSRTDPSGKDWTEVAVTRVTRNGGSYKSYIPVWYDFAAGRQAWTKGVYRVSNGKGTGLWTALDPYSSNFKQFKTRAEAVAARNQFTAQAKQDAAGGAVHAVTSTLDVLFYKPLDPANSVTPAKMVADGAMNSAGINPNENSDVHRSANNLTNVIISTGSVVVPEAMALRGGQAAEVGNLIEVGNLSPLHSEATSGARPALEALSDSELLESVRNPINGDPMRINPNTGTVMDGNGRAYELLRRANNPNSTITPQTRVPYVPHIPDNSAFPDF